MPFSFPIHEPRKRESKPRSYQAGGSTSDRALTTSGQPVPDPPMVNPTCIWLCSHRPTLCWPRLIVSGAAYSGRKIACSVKQLPCTATAAATYGFRQGSGLARGSLDSCSCTRTRRLLKSCPAWQLQQPRSRREGNEAGKEGGGAAAPLL